MKKVLYGICLIVLMTGNILPQELNAVKTKVLIKTNSSWDGSALASYAKGKPEISILEITIPPKTKLPVHEHPEINAGVLKRLQNRTELKQILIQSAFSSFPVTLLDFLCKSSAL